MKLLTFFILVSMVTATASSYSQQTKFNLKLNGVTVRKVFQEIEANSEFILLYNEKQLDANRKVDVKADNETVESILNQVFESTKNTYKIYDRQIVILAGEMNESPTTISSEIFAEQKKVISGTIFDSKGITLPGVSVVAKGTTIGTITSSDGRFTLAVPADTKIMVFSFIGMKTQEIPLDGKLIFSVTLIEEAVGVDEVVIIGYGTIRKSDLTGSISSVSSKDFGDRAGTSIGSLIQGKAAGVDVTADKIRIRGVTTMNNTDPLYVIDGFVGGDMGTVHPSDVSSIEVLKDASATAIYGARGANGVIIVNTKKGKTGPPQFEFSAFYGVRTPDKYFDMLNGQQYMELLKDIEINGGTKPADLYKFTKLFNPDGTFTPLSVQNNTDWQKEMFQSASTQEYTLSVRGGTDLSNYNINMSYNDAKSITGTTDSKSYKISFKGEQQAFGGKWIIGENVRLHHYASTGVSPDIYGGLEMAPYVNVLDPTSLGGYGYTTTTQDLNDANNPVTLLKLQDSYNKGLSLMVNLTSQIKFTNYLSLNTSLGITGGMGTTKTYTKPYQNGNLKFPDAAMAETMSWNYFPKMENYLSFDKIYGKHAVSAMIGNTVEDGGQSRNIGISGKKFINNNVQNITLASSKLVDADNGYVTAYLSYFGRVNYALNNKYLFTANLRADGSSKFAPANRWGRFPSVAIGWKMHEENFMKGIGWINQLKLRGSYGITGNDQIDSYQYFSSIHSKVSYAFPSQGLSTVSFNGATIKTLASPTIRWEEVKNLSFGFDLTSFNNRLDLTLDYFHKNTYDILFQVPLPPSLGLKVATWENDPYVNAASCTNNGFELSAAWRDQIGDFTYRIQGNVTYVKNNVTGLGSGLPYNVSQISTMGTTNRTEVGNPIGYFYGFKVDRIYKTNAEVAADNANAKAKGKAFYNLAATSAGDIRFVDINNDGTIDDNDRTYLGNAIPKFTFGATITLGYKGFDFNTSFTGLSGNSILYGSGYTLEGMVRPFNATTVVLGRWKSESDPGNGVVPRAVKTDPSKNTRMSDRFIYDGSYLRNKLLSVGYTFPKSVIGHISSRYIESVRVYGSVDNLFTITHYPGYNVELGGTNMGRGAENSYVAPNSKTVRFGVSVVF